MTVKVYTPALSVKLIKLVQRKDGVAERYTRADRIVDLTPYLGDAGAVRTMRSVFEAAGGFTIAFSDKMEPKTADSLYALIEPMDMIEIRASRTPHLYAGGTLPLIMRGFVSTVRRSEGMSDAGEPHRAVVVQGQDAGKLWLIHHVWWVLAAAEEKQLLSNFALSALLDIRADVYPISDFIRAVTEKVMNVKIQELAAYSDQQIKPFIVDATVAQGQLLPGVNLPEGTMWGVIEAYADRPWNELWVDDQEDGPHLVFRPAPFKGLDGSLIMPGGADPGAIDVGIEAVVSLDMVRSDARVANFFWVPPGSSSMDTNAMLTVAALQSGAVLDYRNGNNKPELFGKKKMEVGSSLIPTDVDEMPIIQAPPERAQSSEQYVQWHLMRAQQLKALNRDNSVFEEGGALLMGSEALRCGRYLRVTRGDLVSEAYITSVAHNFQPLRTWTTQVALQRGTGFLVRNRASGSPYLLEGRKGPYS